MRTVKAYEFAQQLDLPPFTKRCIIDIGPDDVVMVYYSCYADVGLLTQVSSALKRGGVQAVNVDGHAPGTCEASDTPQGYWTWVSEQSRVRLPVAESACCGAVCPPCVSEV